MGLSILEDVENKEFSPKEIREMLGIDNSGIQELCKIADIKLKKNSRGLTYFTKDDAKILKTFKGKENAEKNQQFRSDRNCKSTLPQTCKRKL